MPDMTTTHSATLTANELLRAIRRHLEAETGMRLSGELTVSGLIVRGTIRATVSLRADAADVPAPGAKAACRWPECDCNSPQGPGECRLGADVSGVEGRKP